MTVHVTTESGSKYVLKPTKGGKISIQDEREKGIVSTHIQPIETGRKLELTYKTKNGERHYIKSDEIVKICIEP